MNRQVVLDTETTGIRIEDGHRVIEIGCVEMIDRKLTGRHFHQYLNPEREIEAGALAVHGITQEFLHDKPNFSKIASDFIEFISGAELIIHNAPFDLSFLNNELTISNTEHKAINDFCRVTDTLQMARQMHAGQRNSLDALCKRYAIDNSKRDFHGALLDAHLLAQVYLAMTGGQGSFFDALNEDQMTNTKSLGSSTDTFIKAHALLIFPANEQEIIEHEKYLKHMQDAGKCLWLSD